MRQRAGFTLVELMIVMTILAVLALGVTPVFRTSFSLTRADHAARDLFAEIKAAGESAVTAGVEHRVYFDTKNNTYWPARPGLTEDGHKAFLPLDVPGGEPIRVPDRLVFGDITGRRAEARSTYYLAFYPSGACDAGQVTLYDASDHRRKYVIETTGTRASIAFPEPQR